MLELRDIKKVYKTANEEVTALKGISLKFRESEFVSILGQSGCGKTTLLNIIGGLDRYTSGDLIINGKSTKKFKNRDWDAYRNYKVGFVFQSYNLISHQTVLSNVELALTIGGISRKERKARAIKALEEVGLKDHIHKKPNQLSGGQMQRVAIARALVNNPDIILADEPTGALDTKTSVQVMELLKSISKDRLIIMVTHNPELAEKYSSRIIKILDGNITEDSNPIKEGEAQVAVSKNEIGRTSMKFWTAFRLSLNNLLTKKGRTFLVSFAGSIGIIGIALVQSVSNGFQAYVDTIEEDTLTSYPLTIMQETTDIAGALLAMKGDENKEKNDENKVVEEQYISKMLASLSTNDLKSFKKHLENNNDELKNDVSSIMYSYSVSPIIYGTDATQKIVKLNPSNLFNSSYSIMGSSFSSTYSQMIDDTETINSSYDILAGRLPEKYDEMLIVLTEKNSISDFLVYSLGLREYKELTDVVTKIMNGEKVELHNEPLVTSYEDLMNIKLKLIMGADVYKYNDTFDVYEDMTEDEEYMQDLYDKALDLKIVGVVAAKEGITTSALNPGVSYRSDLVDYIINYSKNTDIVKRQLEDEEVDVLSGSRFDDPKGNNNLEFTDLISIDTEGLQSAFDINIDADALQEETAGYMLEIADAISTDTTPAENALKNNLNILAEGLFNSIQGEFTTDDIDDIVENYLNENEPSRIIAELEDQFVLPAETFRMTYAGLLKGLMQIYASSYYAANAMYNNSNMNLSNDSVDMQDLMNQLESGTNMDLSQLGELNNNEQAVDSQNLDALRNMFGENGEMTPENMMNFLQGGNQEEINPEDLQKLLEQYQGSNQEKSENNENQQNVITAVVDKDILNNVMPIYINSIEIQTTFETMGRIMTEAVMKTTVLTKVAELTGNLTSSLASAFNVDQDKIAGAFKMNFNEDEIKRLFTTMFSKEKVTAKTNLINFGYQDKEEPTYISFYFKSFDGKERFKKFVEEYNEKVINEGNEDKKINYTDTTGILMGSVKVIVNAVTYVLIAFISISLVVSSIMIGIITYISVYERTKEIGILRAIGASKKNISSIFNAETFIIGLLSGLIGIGVTYALIPPINSVLHKFTGNIPLNATFYIHNAIILVILSVVLTLIGGLIPAKAASKKDPVIALRTE